MDIQRLEEASLNAWPALKQILFDGWILRFSEGYTRRANSVNTLYPSSIDAAKKVVTCEKLYTERGLRTIFRLTPLASPPELDAVLAQRGYRKEAPTLVLHLDLSEHLIEPSPTVQLRDEPLENWLAQFCLFLDSPLAQHQTHSRILEAIPSRRLLAVLISTGQPVACGLGVLEEDYFGLFDLITDPQRRGQGYGIQLTAAMLAWARENQARHAYLQVMEDNMPARHLYAKLGLRQAYTYWYRVADA